MCLFFVQNFYYGIQLICVQAESPKARFEGWVNFAFCMAVNYYQFTTITEYKQIVINVSGWVINIVFFFYMVVMLG